MKILNKLAEFKQWIIRIVMCRWIPLIGMLIAAQKAEIKYMLNAWYLLYHIYSTVFIFIRIYVYCVNGT